MVPTATGLATTLALGETLWSPDRVNQCTNSRYNRQFRYEERDNNGVVHGRYGYYDQYGKLNIVNYTADPYKGFHAEGEHVPKPQY